VTCGFSGISSSVIVSAARAMDAQQQQNMRQMKKRICKIDPLG